MEACVWGQATAIWPTLVNVKTGGKYKKVRIYNKCNKNEIGTDHIQYYYLEKTERSYYNDVVVGLLCLKRWECQVFNHSSFQSQSLPES